MRNSNVSAVKKKKTEKIITPSLNITSSVIEKKKQYRQKTCRQQQHQQYRATPLKKKEEEEKGTSRKERGAHPFPFANAMNSRSIGALALNG